MHSSPSGHRWTIRMASGGALLLAVCMLAGCALPWVPAYSYSSSSSIHSYPGPIPFLWARVTPPAATPQQAYAEGMGQLRLCRGGAAKATTSVWLVAGPTYGAVLVRGDCSSDPVDTRQGIAFFPLALDRRLQPKCPAWELESAMVSTQLPADANLGGNAYKIPSWLPLPKDTYEPEPNGGEIVPSSVLLLESSTRIFVAGRFQGSATRPTGAQTVSIGGRAGWQMSEHGIVTVTAPLADGWTLYFAGTADGATMQRLASAALGHLDALLPLPQPLPANYPQATPAC